MADAKRRIERIEEILEAADCICGAKRPYVVAVRPGGIGDSEIPEEWIKEGKGLAEASMGFLCPTHGLQRNRVLWISEMDVPL